MASSLQVTFFSLRDASSSLAHTLWRSLLYSLRSRSSWDHSKMNRQDAVLVHSSSWVRQSLRRWCSASSASHSRKIAAPVSLRTWWARDNLRGRGLAQLLARHPTGVAAQTPPPFPPEQAGGWSWTRLLCHLQCPKWARIPQLGPPPPLQHHRTPGWGMRSRWCCLSSSWGRTAGTTLSRFLLLRSRPIDGPDIWRRRHDLGSGGGRSPGKQTMG
jgi:hypothetical protein